jgi:hypothetical protein
MNTQKHGENAQPPKKKFWRDYESIEKMTFVMAVFSVIYSLITLGLYLISRQTMQEMQNTNRPYIFTMPKFSFQAVPTLETIGEIPVTVGILNIGVSPALQVVNSEPIVGLETDSEVGEHMRTCSFTYPQQEGLPLPPNQSFTNGSGMTAHTITRTLSDEERKELISQTKHLVVLGGVKYSGVRAGDYETTYCYIWNPESLKGHTLPWSNCSCNKMK